MKSGVAKLYEHLTPHERFQLVVHAEAREDKTEVTALVRSCPKVSYRANDSAFTERMDTYLIVIMAVTADIALSLAMLVALDALDELRFNAIGALIRLEEQDIIPNDDAITLYHLVTVPDRLKKVIAREARSIWEGFCLFCREDWGLEPEIVLDADGHPLRKLLALHRRALDEAEVNFETAEQWRETARQLWQGKLGK